MDIQIGKKTLSVDGVIYISPNGNDSNNGTNRNAPVLTITKAISLCSDNYAVYFMEGNHNLQQKSYGDFINLGGKNIIFYSKFLQFAYKLQFFQYQDFLQIKMY